MTKWHAHVVQMAKHMNMVGALFGGGPWLLGPPLNPAVAHRSNRNTPNCKNYKNVEAALWRHYALFHGNVNKPPKHEAYIVTFVEQPHIHSLNICEKWYNQLDAQINIHSMILPRVT